MEKIDGIPSPFRVAFERPPLFVAAAARIARRQICHADLVPHRLEAFHREASGFRKARIGAEITDAVDVHARAKKGHRGYRSEIG